MSAIRNIFISFRTSEREHALLLKNALVNSGFSVWWQEEIQCGQEWHGEIDKALQNASAIIVLWSKQSLESVWVKHEASQAISKQIYTPVRIEVTEIESPYNRIQATDLFNWNGIESHAGFQNLLTRLKELIPEPVPLYKRAIRLFWNQRLAVILFFITVYAMYLLLSQSRLLNVQSEKQELLHSALEKTKDSLDEQFSKINALTRSIDESLFNTQKKLNYEFLNATQNQNQLRKVTDKISTASNSTISSLRYAIGSLNSLEISQKNVLSNIKRNLFPIEACKMKLRFTVYWNPEMPIFEGYVERLVKYSIEQIKNRDDKDTLATYSFENGLNVRFRFNNKNEIEIRNIWINGISNLLPDCSDFSEKQVYNMMFNNGVYLTFSKNYNPTVPINNQAYLRFKSMVGLNTRNCIESKPYRLLSEKNEVNLSLRFKNGRLKYFSSEFYTENVELEISSPQLISVMDLLNADFEINGGLTNGNFKVEQVGNVILSMNGESLGSINLPNSVSYPPDGQPSSIIAKFKLQPDNFSSGLFTE